MDVVSLATHLSSDPIAKKYAKMLSCALNEVSLDGRMGKLGGFERNKSAALSGIRKAHIRMPWEQPWGKRVPQRLRSSDNFLIYCSHNLIDNHYQIIQIVSPDGHSRIDSMLPAIIDFAESNFHCLSGREIQELETY